MFMDVYYEHYTKNCNGRYWEEQRSTPYLISFPTVKNMQSFMDELRKDGLKCVSSNSSYHTLLVNLDLKRFAVIPKACKHFCKDDRTYNSEDFITEVYSCWKISHL